MTRTRTQTLIDRAIVAYRQSSTDRWVACLAASRVVGSGIGATAAIAGSLGITRSQVENLARAGGIYRWLLGHCDKQALHLTRRRLTIGHFVAFSDLWIKLEFDPFEAFQVLVEAASQFPIISIVQLKRILEDEYGGGSMADWEVHQKAALSALSKMVSDYGVPDLLRAAAQEFIYSANGGASRTLVIRDYQSPSWNDFWAGRHWSIRHKIAQEVKALVRGALDPEEPPLPTPLRIEVAIYFRSEPLSQDSDNILAKMFIDGLKGWWFPDDKRKYIPRTTTISEVDPKDPRIEVRAYSLPGATQVFTEETQELEEV